MEEKKPFLKRLFYKYESKGEVERFGKTYYRYSKVPRFSRRKIRKIFIFMIYVILILLVIATIGSWLLHEAINKK